MDGKMGHTPGPWRTNFLRLPRGRRWTTIEGDPDSDGWTKVAEVHSNGDARLIAAAPDLLEALKAMLVLHVAHHNAPEHVAARAAIARAEGRG